MYWGKICVLINIAYICMMEMMLLQCVKRVVEIFLYRRYYEDASWIDRVCGEGHGEAQDSSFLAST